MGEYLPRLGKERLPEKEWLVQVVQKAEMRKGIQDKGKPIKAQGNAVYIRSQNV